MNTNTNIMREKIEYSNTLSNKIDFNNIYNSSNKIIKKLIIFNNENTIPKGKKIKEFEIKIKNKEINNSILKRQKSNNIFEINKIQNLKNTNHNEPYLKPKLERKNKNSFSLKNKKQNNNDMNDEIKNIYLNFFQVYYDENGKKIKIIKNKSNYKENKSKEIILTQNNKESNNEIKNKRKNNNLKKNYATEFLNFSKNNNIKENRFETKFFRSETPSQSTTNENTSYAKSVKTNNKKEIIENKINNKIINIKNEREIHLIGKKEKNSIHYDNLPKFLKRRKNQKKNGKYNKKNYDNQKKKNIVKLSFFDESNNKLSKINNEQNQGLLINKLKNKIIEINLSNSKKNKKENSKTNKINYFHNDISNLTLNMTFEQKNITNTINSENTNIRNIYISSFKKNNTTKNLRNNNSFCLNTFERIFKKINPRHSIGIHGNHILVNFLNGYRNINRNKSLGYKKLTNYKIKIDSQESSIKKEFNLSFNNNNIIRNNNSFFSNNYNDKENEINILNKTKEILKIKEDIMNDNQSRKVFLDCFPKPIFGFKINTLVKRNMKNSGIMINIPNTEYYTNYRALNKKKITNNKNTNFSQIMKNKRPCSLYINKKLIGKNEKEKKAINSNNYFSLNDNYNNAIDKYSHLNMNINNIYQNKNKIEHNFYYKKIDKKIQGGMKINNSDEDSSEQENIKRNLYDKKFINLNQNSSSQQLINKRIKKNNILKFNRNII